MASKIPIPSSSLPPCSDDIANGSAGGDSAASEQAAGSINKVTRTPSTASVSPKSNSTRLRKLSHALSWLLRHKAREFQLPMSDDGYVPVEACLSCPDAKFSKEPKWTVDDVRAVVDTNDKKRFKLEERCASEFYPPKRTSKRVKGAPTGDGEDEASCSVSDNDHHHRMILCIRANQGHSIPGIDPDQLLTRLTPDELTATPVIVHGTYTDVWEKHIRTEGLKCMRRNHMHFATAVVNSKGARGDPAPVVSGMRRSCQIHIYVNSTKCARDGIVFYRSDNGVLLTSGINGTLPPTYFSHVTDADGTMLMDHRLTVKPPPDDSATNEDDTATSKHADEGDVK